MEANQQALELSEVFSGNRPLARVEKNDRLNKWFKDIGEEIMSLNLDEPGPSGRKIIQLIHALKEVKGMLLFFTVITICFNDVEYGFCLLNFVSAPKRNHQKNMSWFW